MEEGGKGDTEEAVGEKELNRDRLTGVQSNSPRKEKKKRRRRRGRRRRRRSSGGQRKSISVAVFLLGVTGMGGGGMDGQLLKGVLMVTYQINSLKLSMTAGSSA